MVFVSPIRPRPSLALAALAAAAVGTPAAPEGVHAAAVEAQAYERDVATHPSQGDVRTIEGAEARLVTMPDGFFANIDAQELTPGNAYTLWLVVVNEPGACATSPCKASDVLERTAETKAEVGYGDGIIAASGGEGRFSAFQPEGELRHAWFGHGLQDPQRAEIHLVINDHGPLVPDLAQSMIGSYRGGCTDASIPAAFPDTAKADGEAGPNECRLVQDVIFTQSD